MKANTDAAIKDYCKHRDEAVRKAINGDYNDLREFMKAVPHPKEWRITDSLVLLTAHKMRAEITNFTDEERQESIVWLYTHGCKRLYESEKG